MNQKETMIKTARGEIGYKEGADGWTKYGEWYAPAFAWSDWCAMFVSWCAAHAGIPESVIPKTAACVPMLEWYESHGCRTGANEPAQPGDIVLYEWDGEEGAKDGPDHVGIVESVDCADPDRQVLTVIEGNYQNSVTRRVISYRDPRVWATCRPKYAATDPETVDPSKVLALQTALDVSGSGQWDEETAAAVAENEIVEGSKGIAVRLLQWLLLSNGYSLPTGRDDAQAGPETIRAVRAFQTDHRLAADGIVGVETWRALCGV